MNAISTPSCFAATGALQCGFCTPGIVMRTKALVDKKGAALERGDAARHLGAHLCRCTGYVKILDAMELIARGEQPPCDTPGGVGSRGMRYEARELALGDRDYIDDMRMPGMLHGALRLADHARARVVHIDTSRARNEPGVEAVFTAADVPGELRVGIIYTDWPVFIPEGGCTSYLGDVLAIVVASDRETARRAAALVDVTYDVLRPITDPVAAIDDPENAVWGSSTGTCSLVRSIAAAAMSTPRSPPSAHVVHETFQTQRIEHAFVEPEATLATPAARRLALRVVRWPGRVGRPQPDRVGARRRTRARRGRARLERRRLRRQGGHGQPGADGAGGVAPATAGEVHAFTGGEPADAPEAASDPHGVPGRAAMPKVASPRCEARMVGDSGAYASVGMKVLERAAGHASGPYHVPVIDVVSIAARTNNPIGGAFRGFGANQAQFAMEGVIDRLAAAVGMQRLGDPRPQRDHARARCGVRAR